MRNFFAAIILFTRLPLWRIVHVDRKNFTEVIKYWPLVGFITGLTTAGIFWIASSFMTALPAAVLAITARLLLTGAMHEDGLADFFDGFGGGRDKESILSIMKDSHIGCYGTIGLVMYFLLYTSFLYSFDVRDIFFLIIGADVFSKFCTACMINTLTYVRKEEESKVKVIYHKTGIFSQIVVGLVSVVPFIFLCDPFLLLFYIPAIIGAIVLRMYLKKKIGGYTGDCCGASVLIIEQISYLSITILYCW